ncbi:protein DGCR6L isoform X2 [Hyaena hyaena]|uniref:protein DGCR6L isoform X2 n=1 Tax=Hyaena hyaena TaxID=95912 RepID=UPI0019220126|nr:protein DGCR6L isoform X2 [Hyaena hyaena]
MERYGGAFEEAVDGARQQERHYQLLSALQSLVKELPSSFQQRLSYTTLSDLALALLDGTVFEIVQGLLEIQHLTEKSLYNQRLRLQNEHRVARSLLVNITSRHSLPRLTFVTCVSALVHARWPKVFLFGPRADPGGDGQRYSDRQPLVMPRSVDSFAVL